MKIPVLNGRTYSLTETDAGGYAVSSTVSYAVPGENQGDPPISKTDSYTDANVPEHTMLSDHTVAYTNCRDGIVPTGIALSLTPAIALICVAAILLGVLAAERRRKRSDDQGGGPA